MCEKGHPKFTPFLSINVSSGHCQRSGKEGFVSPVKHFLPPQSHVLKCHINSSPCCSLTYIKISKGSSESKVNSHMEMRTFKCELGPDRARVNSNLPHSIWALQGTQKPDLSYTFGKTPDPIQTEARTQPIKLVPQFSL